MSNIAIFGGTFNPFHIGHYEMLKCLCNTEFIDKVLVIPASIPPHKDFDATVNDRDRINMCQIACLEFSNAEVSTIEFERDERSYTYDTIMLLKEKFPEDDFFVTCGADMIATLDTWYKFENLKDVTKFIAFNRAKDKEFLKNVEKMRSFGAEIIVLNEKITDVSSTQLRNKLEPDLLTKNIYEYLLKRKIYNV